MPKVKVKKGDKLNGIVLTGDYKIITYPNGQTKRKYGFICICGEVDFSLYTHLKNRKGRKCNCFTSRHGMSGTNFYFCWNGMINRCNKKLKYISGNYHKNDIKVCSRWRDFSNFKEDMYGLYIEHKKTHKRNKIRTNTTLDRINNLGDYEPSNCRWATCKEQSQNK